MILKKLVRSFLIFDMHLLIQMDSCPSMLQLENFIVDSLFYHVNVVTFFVDQLKVATVTAVKPFKSMKWKGIKTKETVLL